jgi:HSP20 family protein
MATPVRRNGGDFDPFRIVDALLGDAFGNVGAPVPAPSRAFTPTFEVKETKDAYVFKADLPGIAEKDVEIQMTGNVLTISGERRQESAQDTERYFALERGYGRFSRSFTLPDGIEGENVTADMKDGVLTLRVPKRPEVQPRKISIGGAAPAKS